MEHIAHGCDHTILYRDEDIAARVRDITDGKGVPVVYDSVGKSTLMASLDSLAPRGLLVSFGNASGPVDNFNLGVLAQKGSLYVTRPTLMTYIAERENMIQMARDLFEVVESGAVKIKINQRYKLSEAAQAHDSRRRAPAPGPRARGCRSLRVQLPGALWPRRFRAPASAAPS